jgi:hypothetical protein
MSMGELKFENQQCLKPWLGDSGTAMSPYDSLWKLPCAAWIRHCNVLVIAKCHKFHLDIMFLWIVGDQSDLHIIIFDEIDAICKVFWSHFAVLKLGFYYSNRFLVSTSVV